jgi:hypothetical protein
VCRSKFGKGLIPVLVITTVEEAELLFVRGIVSGINIKQDLPSFPATLL